ncbi:MAG: glycosyltransferase [Phycisphaerae bacterium]|nr:glycosyltransferase [Phycisphaerae bacterium]
MNNTEPPQSEVMFSVIMPVYNHAAYLPEAIESVIGQTTEDWEMIIVDDGSTDESPAIARRFAQRDNRITVLSQKNSGPAKARNTALKQARGKWLAFIDSDDIYLPDALKNFAKNIAANPDASFFYGFRHRLNADGTRTELSGEFQDAPSGAVELFQRMYLSHLCVCWKKSLLDEVGGYDNSLRSCEDYELYLRMSLLTKFYPIGCATGWRRRHDKNLSKQTGESRWGEAEILRAFIDKRGGKDVVPSDIVSRRLGKLYYSSGRQYFKACEFRKAVKGLNESTKFVRRFKTTALNVLAHLLSPFGK